MSAESFVPELFAGIGISVKYLLSFYELGSLGFRRFLFVFQTLLIFHDRSTIKQGRKTCVFPADTALAD